MKRGFTDKGPTVIPSLRSEWVAYDFEMALKKSISRWKNELNINFSYFVLRFCITLTQDMKMKMKNQVTI